MKALTRKSSENTKRPDNMSPDKPAKKKSATIFTFGSSDVPVTHPDKIYWPKEKITKGEVVKYYQSISEYILPYLKGRSQSLLRMPNGIDKPGFFHKNAGEGAPEWIESIKLYSEAADREIDYILCNNKATLAYLNNLGCIEINPWHSTVKKLNNPDYLVIDLDPSAKNTFDEVIKTGKVVKKVLDRAGADAYCKTSGATGLHIYIPVKKKYTYDQVKEFAHLVCKLVQGQLPELTSLERSLKKRGNKIYLDHLQNRRGQTIASVYSLRPRTGATVSTPLDGKEVKKGLSPQNFTMFTIFERLKKKGDLFKGVLGKGIDLKRCLTKLSA
ncbi:DNA polymerase LigD [Sphingobacteriaceae bacterium]|nr:DNA polymerase LigD [Sphingobacteriaceae bacterium]